MVAAEEEEALVEVEGVDVEVINNLEFNFVLLSALFKSCKWIMQS